MLLFTLLNSSWPLQSHNPHPVTQFHAYIHHEYLIIWYNLDHEPFLFFSIHFSFRLICPKNIFFSVGYWAGLSQSLILFVRSITSDLHLRGYPLYLLSWRHFLNLDFGSNVPPSTSVFLTCLDFVIKFLFTKKLILGLLTLVVFLWSSRPFGKCKFTT